ncbi:hypothetical protein [Bifidobacterium saguini]|uniref:hypothetical protein n=1 Tax=Bifidobacterium saguini TaxID=762210 RepID=UPI00126995CD|nr:hypothetical protein [Bifidobacterium saguini]
MGVITAVAAPLIGYISYCLGVSDQHAELLADSPEYANDTVTVNLLQWLTGQTQTVGRILGIIAIIGIQSAVVALCSG